MKLQDYNFNMGATWTELPLPYGYPVSGTNAMDTEILPLMRDVLTDNKNVCAVLVLSNYDYDLVTSLIVVSNDDMNEADVREVCSNAYYRAEEMTDEPLICVVVYKGKYFGSGDLGENIFTTDDMDIVFNNVFPLFEKMEMLDFFTVTEKDGKLVYRGACGDGNCCSFNGIEIKTEVIIDAAALEEYLKS
jgi:hypothetical protein